jgi:hypothetical protein
VSLDLKPQPPSPEDVDALIEEARERARRRRRWGALVAVCALGLGLGLYFGIGGGGGGSGSRPGASSGGGAAPARHQTSASSGSPVECSVANTAGDFDGDGTRDVASLVAVAPTCQRPPGPMQAHRLRVTFGSGAQLDQPFKRCSCIPYPGFVFTATDLDGDGRSELAVEMGPGAAIDNVEFFRVTRQAIRPLRIAPTRGAGFHLRNGPAVLGGGFDSGGVSPVSCRVRPNGSRALIATQASPIKGNLNGPWRVKRAQLVLRGNTLHVVRASKTITRHGFAGSADRFRVTC